jgi:IMP dehydrogenase
VIVGNIATPEAALFLVENGADVKVGMDLVQFVPRIVAGVGFPQFCSS